MKTGITKKGQIPINSAIKLLVVIVGALVIGYTTYAIGANVLDNLYNSYDPQTYTRITNESHYANQTAGFNLTNAFVDNTSSILIINQSSKGIVAASNYRLIVMGANNNLQVNFTGYTNETCTPSISCEVGVNYTYSSGQDTATVNITRSTLDGTAEFGDFGGVTGLTAAAVVVLVLVSSLILIGGGMFKIKM